MIPDSWYLIPVVRQLQSGRMSLTRRSFLQLPLGLAMLPSAALGQEAHAFSHDHVIGTSLDLLIWSQDRRIAVSAHDAVLAEVTRLARLLDTRDPSSEISLLEHHPSLPLSYDVRRLLGLYDEWQTRTDEAISVRPLGPGTPRDVDALGKAYIIDRAIEAARSAAPSMRGALLNIGGDIVAWGEPAEVAVADPNAPYDNAAPIALVRLCNAAIATSGVYARGQHLIEPRSGRPALNVPAVSVIAPDAVTANALATAMCVSPHDRGLTLVERVAGAHALTIDADGPHRSSGFASLERPLPLTAAQATTKWPEGYQVTLSLTLTQTGNAIAQNRRGAVLRPYVAIWVENSAAKIVRVLAVWATEPRYFTELPVFFTRVKRNRDYVMSLSRVTRPPGHYDLFWDGRDQDGMSVEPGSYKITVEANRENGGYGKQSGTLVCGDAPTRLTLPATVNFEAVAIEYGPRAG
jgi:thiamine biosynthesis lipoprotein